MALLNLKSEVCERVRKHIVNLALSGDISETLLFYVSPKHLVCSSLALGLQIRSEFYENLTHKVIGLQMAMISQPSKRHRFQVIWHEKSESVSQPFHYIASLNNTEHKYKL